MESKALVYEFAGALAMHGADAAERYLDSWTQHSKLETVIAELNLDANFNEYRDYVTPLQLLHICEYLQKLLDKRDSVPAPADTTTGESIAHVETPDQEQDELAAALAVLQKYAFDPKVISACTDIINATGIKRVCVVQSKRSAAGQGTLF